MKVYSMRRITISQSEIQLIKDCLTSTEVMSAVRQLLDGVLLPPQFDALILIKPNLNNDLSALTGNATDLRLLVAVIEALQELGYTNIVIGDDPNIGIYRKGIDVFKRLAVTALAQLYDVHLVDLNHQPSTTVEFTTGPVRVAKICLEADFMINLPKLKTHAEAGMSLAVKNLMGCVVGKDKRLMHADLAANLVDLNEVIKPDLHIADALVAMEGNGPGDGWPRRTDTLLAGTDAFRLDLIAARLFGLVRKRIPYLTTALRRGHLTVEDLAAADALQSIVSLEPPPNRGRLTRTMDHPVFHRFKDLTRPLHEQEWVRRLLYWMGIMQDVYQSAEAAILSLHLDHGLCDSCGCCLDYCPLALPITASGFDFNSSRCIKCLYCVYVCPREAILIEGEQGYLRRHLAKYGQAMQQL